MLAMHLLVLFATGLAMAQANSVPPLAAENNCSSTMNYRSLLSSILTVTGFSDTCVTSALDFCSTGQENNRYTSLMEEAREVVQQLSTTVNTWESQVSAAVNTVVSQVSAAVNTWKSQVSAAAPNLPLPRHCKDLLDYGDKGRGLRQVYPHPGRPNENVTVYCDHTIDGGGWIVFQRRTSDAERQDFYRNWTEYQSGFGNLEGEFHLGLDLLHQLTSITQQQLRIDLHDYDGEHRWAKYGYFHVGPPGTNYRLSVRIYSGDAGDSLAYHNGQPFSTHDADNDSWSSDCAESRRGAWWYKSCQHSSLNGYQYVGNDSPIHKGITWYHWRGYEYSLKGTTMMTRPAV